MLLVQHDTIQGCHPERSASGMPSSRTPLERGVEGSRRCVPYHAATRRFNETVGAAVSIRARCYLLKQITGAQARPKRHVRKTVWGKLPEAA